MPVPPLTAPARSSEGRGSGGSGDGGGSAGADTEIDRQLMKRLLITYFGSVESTVSRAVRTKSQNQVIDVMARMLVGGSGAIRID